MAEKKYWFFKMEDDFFRKKEVKRLRTIAGGDTFTIIYQKLILLSLKTGGKLYFEGIDDTFADEISLEIDEGVENVRLTLSYLDKHSMINKVDDNEYDVSDIGGNIGSQTSSALRVKKHRELKKQGLLQCNAEVTDVKQIGNGELELEKELKSDKEKDVGFDDIKRYIFASLKDKGIDSKLWNSKPFFGNIKRLLNEHGKDTIIRLWNGYLSDDFAKSNSYTFTYFQSNLAKWDKISPAKKTKEEFKI